MLVYLLACTAEPILLKPLTNTDASDPERLIPENPVKLPSGTADFYVAEDGSGDFTSIQDAIDKALPGDWILVSPGNYEESINFNGKALWITSTDGPEATTIRSDRNDTVVAATHGETSETTLSGFTLTGGRSATVYVNFASLHLENIIVTDSSPSYLFYGSAADLELDGVVVEGNSESGAVINMSRGSLQLFNSSLECGRSSYAVYTGHGYAQVDNSSLACGRGYAFYSEHTVGTVIRSTLEGNLHSNNEDDHPEDVIILRNSTLTGRYEAVYGGATIINSIVEGGVSFSAYTGEGDDGEDVPGVAVIENSVFLNAQCSLNIAGEMTVRNNAFWNTTPSCTDTVFVGVDGNIDENPRFINEASGDYHLQNGSPLINAGVDEAGYEDIDGSRNDIGVFGGIFSMDGGW
jgi:hypothetical protein